MTCTQLWLKTGTAKKRQYIHIHDIVDHMPYNVPGFHALTGSDTMSYIAGCSKRSAWKTFQTHHQILENLGKGELTAETLKNAEQFVCKLYNINNVSNTNEARVILLISHAHQNHYLQLVIHFSFTYNVLIIKQPYGDKLIWPIQIYQIQKPWVGRLKKQK